ncbi:Gti1/Pac2 family-domain-containing protein [Lactarius sanguifluus]|nr:Gti1/Pac2 family-domain-containing protein [Lactarius sanguifluus]
MSPTYNQQPTLQNVRIRTAQDALQVFFAVARNVLTLLTRRLDADERKAIRSGNVYIWEDRSASTVDSGGLTMERWTDGMSWGPSRIREVCQTRPRNASPAAEGEYFTPTPLTKLSVLPFLRRMSFPLPDSDKLIKQTYSVYVFLPEDRGQDITRKWHLTAYFNQSTVDELTPIEDVPNVGRITVPEGLFKSARATKSKRDDPRRNAFMTSGGSESYASESGALYTIFPSSGNGPQTTHPYTQDGSPSRSNSAAPVPVSPSPRMVHSGVHSPRSSHPHAGPSSTLPRTLPVPVPPTTPARVPGVRHPPSLGPA